ncbi:hypothetical protein OROGR_012947 [Orobanche gracilis]
MASPGITVTRALNMDGNGESDPLVLEDLNVMNEDDLGSFGRDETISILESEGLRIK